MLETKIQSQEYYYGDFSAESELMEIIRRCLSGDQKLHLPKHLHLPFDPQISQTYITLFQPGLKKIRWGSRRKDLQTTLQRIVDKLKTIKRFLEFDIDNSDKCRIMLEIVIDQAPCNIRNLTIYHFSKDRFEAGITGLKYTYKGVNRFFMPTDAVTHSILTVNQLLNFLSKQTGHAKLTNSIKERVHLMRREPIDYEKIISMAFITHREKTLPLHRGYPMPVEFNKTIMYESTMASIEWLYQNMGDDGSFLYFYDGSRDTKVDLDHPAMVDPLYNNILRHSGGTITLLRGYQISGDKKYLLAARKSIDFFISTFKEHEYQGQYACFPYFNKKSKLGGAGIGMVALMHYYMHTRDETYRKYMDGLVRHMLSRVADDGEMIGYYLHPRFNGHQPLTFDFLETLSLEEKKQLFSFYYPGEALLGLALYYRHINNIDPDLKRDIYEKSLRALDFLVDERPVRYRELFLSLPADAWLMQAIEEWVKVDGFQKQSYIDFVFNDTQQMIDHMYKEEDSPWFDYVGGFYYSYGDSVYHDGSRCEGVIAAWYLAKYLGYQKKADEIMKYMLKSARGLMYTRHTEASMYAHKYPHKSLNSFRFKLTRQWVRVDSVQHTACFFARLYQTDFNPDWIPPDTIHDKTQKQFDTSAVIGKYQVEKLLANSGFSKTFLAHQRDDKQSQYVIKQIHHSRYINYIETEAKILDIVNQYEGKNRLYCHQKFEYNGQYYFVFDYINNGHLHAWIRKHGPATESQAMDILQSIIQVLKFVHAKHVLHLDIKPANILLDNKFHYYLCDWGLAKQEMRVKTIHIKGNPVYMAPEMYREGIREVASEVYGLGATLYFILHGKPPFGLKKSKSLAQKIYSHCYLQPEFADDISPKMRYLILRMMEKDPEKRADFNEIEKIMRGDSNNILPKVQKNSPPDFSDEVEIWTMMARDKVAYAAYNMGKHASKSEQLDEAVKWYQIGVNKGLAKAEYGLARCYQKMGQQQQESERLLYFAAQKGLDRAQYHYGLLMEQQGKRQDAIDWFIASAKNAYRPAYKKLSQYQIEVRANID